MITHFGINCRSPKITPFIVAPVQPNREPFNLSSDLRALGFDALSPLLVVPAAPHGEQAETFKSFGLRPIFPYFSLRAKVARKGSSRQRS
jgi:hypothetical protein